MRFCFRFQGSVQCNEISWELWGYVLIFLSCLLLASHHCNNSSSWSSEGTDEQVESHVKLQQKEITASYSVTFFTLCAKTVSCISIVIIILIYWPFICIMSICSISIFWPLISPRPYRIRFTHLVEFLWSSTNCFCFWNWDDTWKKCIIYKAHMKSRGL